MVEEGFLSFLSQEQNLIYKIVEPYHMKGTNPDSSKNALKKFLAIEATRWKYTHGVKNENARSPDNWIHDQLLLDRPGNNEIQLQLFYDYRSNPPIPYQRDLKNMQLHFALKEEDELIAELISRFLLTQHKAAPWIEA